MYIKTGVKKDGTIVARTGKVFYDAGGYSGFGVQAGGRCTNMLGGWYLMPNCHIEGYHGLHQQTGLRPRARPRRPASRVRRRIAYG